jgi:DNA-binding NarL/FixJ family response regulator
MKSGNLRGALPQAATPRQIAVLAAFVAAGGSVSRAATLVGIRPSTVKRHLADLRARSGLSTEQLIYLGTSSGWLVVPTLAPREGSVLRGAGSEAALLTDL